MDKTIGILTGGGDVPGLNPCIKAIVVNALEEGYQVIVSIKDGRIYFFYNPKEPSTSINYLGICPVKTFETVAR